MKHGFVRQWDLNELFWTAMKEEADRVWPRVNDYQLYCDVRATLQGCPL